ncbi:MAG: superoxide dismutase, Cu-Zn family [Mycobacterium sp.]|jgi:Cu-Zn family superoxide dismutase|nr:superoxide dismutase, Cu-Zn family [Mycobacterium sp.]
MIKHVSAAIALLVTPVAVLAGCSNQPSNTSPTSTTSKSSSNAQTLSAQLNTSDGKHAADATVDFTQGYATVTVQTVAAGILSPGFHGLHIHAVGKCETASGTTGGGQSSDFASAGNPLQAAGHTGQPASGDLPPLLVRSDGSGKLVATTDGFTADELKGPDGSSIVLDQGSDMGSQGAANGEQRTACGVLSPASTTSTSVSTSTSTSTVTTTAAVPPATVTSTTETTTPPSPTSTTAASTSTSTSTVTVIQPTIPPITIPGPGNVPGPNGG